MKKNSLITGFFLFLSAASLFSQIPYQPTGFVNDFAGVVDPDSAQKMEAIASAVIGGTLLTGGVGNVIGSLFGVLIKGTIESFITTQGTLSSWWTRIVISLLLAFFIVLQSIFASIKSKNR